VRFGLGSLEQVSEEISGSSTSSTPLPHTAKVNASQLFKSSYELSCRLPKKWFGICKFPSTGSIHQEGVQMKRVRTVFFTVLIGLVSVAMATAVVPALADTAQDSGNAQQSAQTKSVTGKITAVEKNSFTLSIGAALSTESAPQQSNQKTMTFGIDQNTTIEGKLQVGSTADVTYRETNGKFLAISVRVMQ
jgi:hypothetical protein